ncbi:MAG TPA: sulfatase, partial [Candidatus Binatia bacterium]|nr:sulfatase [Candidatus Binatia bacterium]
DLVLRPGARIDLFARAPAGARLHLAPGPDALVLTIAHDGVAERDLPIQDADIDLGIDADTPFRLRLAVPPGSGTVRLASLDLAGRAPRAVAPAPVRRRTSVLLYVADTLRADALGTYGYDRPTSPHIDALSRRGITFETTVAASSWTRPSTATLLTGLPPPEHGALTLRDPIRPGVARVAEAFRGAGFATGGFVTNVNVADQFGFGDGFDVYQYLPEDVARRGVHAPADDLHAAALAWLDQQHDGPVFLYLHATDTHAPYEPAPETAARFVPPGLTPTFGPDVSLRDIAAAIDRVTPDDVRTLRGRYDAEVADLDGAVGRLITALRKRGVWDDLVVIFVADHGEEFFEHGGLEHGATLYREVLHVPLIVRLPHDAGAGGRVTALSRHVDVAPTMLALAGVVPPTSLPGRILVDADGTPTSAPPLEAIAETYLGRHRLQALVTEREKVVIDGRDGSLRVYDLGANPGETTDRSIDHPILAGYARQTLDATKHTFAWAGGGVPGRAPALDPATAERLEALGYLNE